MLGLKVRGINLQRVCPSTGTSQSELGLCGHHSFLRTYLSLSVLNANWRSWSRLAPMRGSKDQL